MGQAVSRLASEFGVNTFSFELMKERLPGEFYDKLMFAIRNQRAISQETADVIAHAMKEWAVANGATHYTHWFQPLTGLTAEKHDSFLTYDDSGKVIDRFSGRQLIMSEPDASSFPHGGLRSTFEARGYAAWDPSSPAFLMRRGDSSTLCLPSIYVSYTGEVLDKKTPLLRSVNAVSKSAVRMLRALGNKRVTGVMPYLGAEQEYFLVDRVFLSTRPDLKELGATLLGAGPARGQQMEDHYFRAIPQRVLSFMEEMEMELVRLGIPAKTRHNEVAPAQFELAVLHRPVNIAADQNQLVMEILRRVAPGHGMEALLHEKPFARVNGSGKHNNWSLIDSEGVNLLEPGTNRTSRLRFLVFLMAVIRGVANHGPLLRAIVASPGNDLRLGGQEAPPAIMSVHLGGQLNSLLEDLAAAVAGKGADEEVIDLGLAGIAKIPRDTTDRNRTSPFAFTGNKFEFRAVGSSAAVSIPNAVMNAMTAQSLDFMCKRMGEIVEAGEPREAAVVQVLRGVIEETAHVRYDGDNYTEEWMEEAGRRGLVGAATTPEALDALVSEPAVELFETYGLMNRAETEARHRVRVDYYLKTVTVELRIFRQILSTRVLSAALRYQRRLAESYTAARDALSAKHGALKPQRAALEELSGLVKELLEAIDVLGEDEERLGDGGDPREMSIACAREIRPRMARARAIADRLEAIVDASDWTLPGYDEMLSL